MQPYFSSSSRLFHYSFFSCITALVSNHHFLPVKVLNVLQSSNFSIFCLISWADWTSVSHHSAFVFINTVISKRFNFLWVGLCHTTALGLSLIIPLPHQMKPIHFFVRRDSIFAFRSLLKMLQSVRCRAKQCEIPVGMCHLTTTSNWYLCGEMCFWGMPGNWHWAVHTMAYGSKLKSLQKKRDLNPQMYLVTKYLVD